MPPTLLAGADEAVKGYVRPCHFREAATCAEKSTYIIKRSKPVTKLVSGIRCRPVLEAVTHPAKMYLLERVPLRKLSRFGFEGPGIF